jgi:chemotaxis protein methyltransferase CheR
MNTQELRTCILNCEAEFIQLISQRLGIILRHKNTDLMHSIVNACHTFKCNPKEYLCRLKHCADNSPLLEHLIADITVGETYFFRDKQQINLLKKTILPKIIAAKREKNVLSLRVWSAACSSGEEIYTIALLLRELLPDRDRWVIRLLGTDINIMALNKAKKAAYSKWSMRSIPDYYKNRYFSEKNNQFYLSPEIINTVDFQYLNLNDNTYPSILNGTNSQDLIICRNALIYFSKDSIARLMNKMSTSLVEGGTLMLGASDPVVITGTNLVLHHNEGMFLTRKTVDTITSSSLQIKKVIAPKRDSQINNLISLTDITKLFKAGRWQEVVTVLDTADTSNIDPQSLLIVKAKAFANLGQLNEAVYYCQQSLLLDATSKETYFIYALALSELNQLEEAEAALRKTLFLDRKFVEAHFQLGLLLIKNCKIDAGLKALDNALAIAKSADASCMVEGFNGLNYGRFAEILKTEIELVARSAYDKKTAQ